ncbi:MAG: DUF429 domain-containing protein [Chloroflexota bacterium]
MLENAPVFIGVDPTAGREPFTYAALDEKCRLITLSSGEMESVLSFIVGFPAARVAINAPARPNLGLVRKRLQDQNPQASSLRGADMRLAEYELRERSITVSPTSSQEEYCSAWTRMGFELYRQLGKLGFRSYPSGDAPRQFMETHPHAAFCVLLDQVPMPKPMLEGRLQRQLSLFTRQIGINDPMDFFEEITRYKLINGILPTELIYLPEELDTIMAAYVAYLSLREPNQVILLGDKEEGQIVLPTTGLKEEYS